MKKWRRHNVFTRYIFSYIGIALLGCAVARLRAARAAQPSGPWPVAPQKIPLHPADCVV